MYFTLLLALLTAEPTSPFPFKKPPVRAEEPTAAPKASITATSGGQPIQEQSDGTHTRTITIALGQQIKLSSEKAVHANTPGSLAWNVKPSSTQTEVFPDGDSVVLTAPVAPATISVQQIVSLDNVIAFQELLIICGKGSQPPPEPEPEPPVPSGKLIRVVLVSSAMKANKDEITIRNSQQFWNDIKLRGHDWIFYEPNDSSTRGKFFAKAAPTLQPPFLVLEDMETNKVLSSLPLPKSFEAIEEAIKKAGGK